MRIPDFDKLPAERQAEWIASDQAEAEILAPFMECRAAMLEFSRAIAGPVRRLADDLNRRFK